MKNKLTILIFTAIPLLLLSCETFTEVDLPQSQLSGQAVFENTATANNALADIYARLREGGLVSGTSASGTALMANYADDLDFYGTDTETAQFNNHTLLPSNTLLSRLWNNGYAQIYAANALMEGVQNSSAITGEPRDRLVGEALFIRAYLHFYLTNLFGEIPYCTTTNYNINKTIAKIPQTQVYTLIFNDLAQSEALLPVSYPSSGRVRINKGVVTAFQARVHLYAGNWADAELRASQIINNPAYTWEPNLNAVFLKDSPAIIWSLHPGVAGLNTLDARTFTILDGPPFKPTLSNNLYDAFSMQDLRKTLWIKTVSDGAQDYHQAYKYKQESKTPTSQEYTILFRLEEQYLIRAEARVHLGNISGAQQDLNMTRNRAGLPDTAEASAPQLLEAILKERRLEFFTEQSHRWFDLKRTNFASATLAPVKSGWTNTDILLPLPANELILNNNLLPQNPGY